MEIFLRLWNALNSLPEIQGRRIDAHIILGKADYERQTSDISAVLTRLNAERAELANGVDNEHPALVAFMKYQNIEALNREILVELVDYIKVYENGNISVKFKFADELRKIAEYIEINTTEDTAVAG